eukprot:XP_012809246.2 PREDICTED: alpha-1-macroglobulin-like [Xenopus tropicalis]
MTATGDSVLYLVAEEPALRLILSIFLVLPQYEVQVKLPATLTILGQEVPVTVCSRYTYGKPVLGRINVRVCRKFSDRYNLCQGEEDGVCEEISQRADPNGCISDVVNRVFQMRRAGYEMKIIASAKITEDGTGRSR